MTRVLVTGSRDWDDAETIRAALDAQLAIHGTITVIHGAARGADRIAGEWAREQILARKPVRLEVYPAAWDEHGKKAGIIRNRQMVELGADVCLAFPAGESRGTRHCMREAAAAGIKVINHDTGCEMTDRKPAK